MSISEKTVAHSKTSASGAWVPRGLESSFRPVPVKLKKAAVIGAGPIGCATAGWLSRAGLEVGIYDVDPAAIEPIRRLKKVRLRRAAEIE
ncbi:MAG: hypothetical protein JRJ19_13860, partial [Deltaproteobacteria bacterium]|nr:hypothetical protein [Deltaproteobacteria bacterium]